MPQIRHLAIVTLNPEKLARFYEEVFDMKLLNSGGGAYYVTDGHITLALLPNKAEGKPSGLNHFGFQIEDAEEIARRLDEHGMAPPAERPADRPYAETRATDPDGNNYDLSVHGFQESETKLDRLAKKPEPVKELV